jgi:hypothetical protein
MILPVTISGKSVPPRSWISEADLRERAAWVSARRGSEAVARARVLGLLAGPASGGLVERGGGIADDCVACRGNGR